MARRGLQDFVLPALRRAAARVMLAAALAVPAAICSLPVQAETLPVASDLSSAATDARIAGDEARTRFVLDLQGQVPFIVSNLADPYRVIIDLPSMEFKLPEGSGTDGRGLIRSWRYGVFAKGKARIVLDLTEPAKVDKSFVLEAIEDQPARLVVDLVKTSREEFLAEAERTHQPLSAVSADGQLGAPKADKLTSSAGKTKPVVVLDPGHGGIDTGAIGLHGTFEKSVVLSFAQSLKAKLEATGHYTVHMTREDDTFIPLRKRVQIARSYNADLLVSIHADSVRDYKEEVRGATVYTLSERASDALAAQIAASENFSDVLAGVELSEEPAEVADILVDLARRETKIFSSHFSKILVEELRSAVKLINNPQRSAGFMVLKAHDVPSVLVELGYLSNEQDEKLLISPEWRERTATAVADAIEAFFQPRFAMDKGAAEATTAGTTTK
ncbi:N-acetylmuramoyl-L-alanine amidase [Pannonibacter sp. Pt2]|uniref:N-acetylmuramoyl-L-alanine amidase n=1 Tax=Pannonibacter anstelovis TaxID=3121537 RepID=A0ABU7ZJ08_9HYPH